VPRLLRRCPPSTPDDALSKTGIDEIIYLFVRYGRGMPGPMALGPMDRRVTYRGKLQGDETAEC
jgi:hypothetical protein